MRVYTARNYLATRSFVKEVLKYCRGKPKFLIDKAQWLISALKSLNLKFEHQPSGRGVNRISVFFSEVEGKDLLLLY